MPRVAGVSRRRSPSGTGDCLDREGATARGTVKRTVLPERLLLMVALSARVWSRGGSSPGPARQDHRLLVGHLGDRGARAFLADAAALEAAVRHEVGAPERGPVDVDVAGVDLADALDRPCEVGGEDPGGETERGAVGLGEGGLPVVVLTDRDGRAEQLFLAEL